MKSYILMSDIIDSSSKDQKLLMTEFKKCTNYINIKYLDDILSPLTITLGDEFQGVIRDLYTSVRIMVDIEEFIIKNNFEIKLRYVLLLGNIDTEINNQIAYEMLGDGLTSARRLINSMKNTNFRFHVDVDDWSKNTILNNIFVIYENIVDKWNLDKDSKLIKNFIEFNDYKIVSERMKKDRSLIWKREKSLNISMYNSSKEIIYTIANK